MGRAMRERVITLMWGDAWRRYGKRFALSFAKFWPSSVELTVVTDEPHGMERRADEYPIFDVPAWQDFMDRHRTSARAQGRESRDRKAKPGERFWKHDAVKWAPQGLCPMVGLQGLSDGDMLAWFDADVETTAPVPAHWLNILLDGRDVACLLRGTQHPEIGFWCIRVGKATRVAVREFAALYASDRIFALPEWHSAYAWQHAFREIDPRRVTNLNPTMMRGHCWPHTRLAQYTVHKKGKLKGQ